MGMLNQVYVCTNHSFFFYSIPRTHIHGLIYPANVFVNSYWLFLHSYMYIRKSVHSDVSSNIGELEFLTPQKVLTCHINMFFPCVYDNSSMNNLTPASSALSPYFSGDRIH